MITGESVPKYFVAIRTIDMSRFGVFAHQVALHVVSSRSHHPANAAPVDQAPGGGVRDGLQELHNAVMFAYRG
jgi:hypothetical protein